MRVSSLMILLLVISMFITGFVHFSSSINQSYRMNLTNESGASYTFVAGTSNLTADISNQLQQSQVSSSDTLTTFVQGAFTGGKMLLSLPGFFNDLITNGFNSMPGNLKPGQIFQTGFIALALVVVVFGLLYAIFKIKW